MADARAGVWSSLQDLVDWEAVRSWMPPSWVLAAAGSAVAAYLVYKSVRILRTDCDLTLMSKRLRPQYFSGRVVWVTGASSGIGEALCRELSKHGALLIMSARSEQTMETIKHSLAHPDNAKILPLDLSDASVCRSATEKAMELFGRVDILINNAGVSQRCFFMDTDEKTDDAMMQINYKAPRSLSHAVIPGMLAQDFGHIVNISSVCGKSGMPLRSTYCATKFALHGLTHTLHYEFHDKKNLHFTVICPGPVQTSIDQNSYTRGGRQYGKSDSLNQEGMTTQRCAELTLVAISNKLLEEARRHGKAWISPKPGLCVPYMAHYTPGLLHYLWRRKAGASIYETLGRSGY